MLWSKLMAAAAMQITLSWFLGLVFIPVFRKLRTGVYTPYIGDRYSADGSEPAFGGVTAWVVFAFGIMISAAFSGHTLRLLAAVCFTAAVTLRGAADDYMTDVCKKPYGVKSGAGLGWCYAVCLAYIFIAKQTGAVGSAVIFPFGLGMIDFGAAFCPVTAAVMTAEIYSFKYLDRFGVDDDSCVGGLVWAVGFVTAMGVTVMGSTLEDSTLLSYGVVTAAACGGAMIWGLSPSKQRSGSSGGCFVGAVFAAVMGLTGFYQTAFWIMTLAAGADAFCTLIQYVHFRRTKQLLLKGSSLHEHLRAKGFGDYAVILIFGGISLIGAAAACGLVFYGQSKFF